MALLKRVRRRLHFWRWYLTEFHPIAGGADPDPEPKPDPDPDPKDPKKKEPDPDPEPKPDPDPDDKVDPDDDWQAKSRKHERAAKKARKEAEELTQKLREREDADKSEQQKAIDKAKEEARSEAMTEAEKERRSDRLEVAVTRLAAMGFKVGEGEEAKTVRFADSEDALVNIERELTQGDLDPEEIFDSNGKVNTDALKSALQDLIKRKPHLAAGEGNDESKPSGDPDGGKGGDGKSVEDMSAEDHFQRIRRHKD